MMLSNKKTGRARLSTMLSAVVLVLVVSMLSGYVKRNEAVMALTTSAPQKNEIAATYKDGKVTQEELQKFIDTLNFMNPQQAEFKDAPEFKEYMLKQLVMTKILNARASEQIKNAVEIKVRQQMDPVQKIEPKQKEQLDNDLKAANLVMADIERYFHMTFTVVEYMSSKVSDQQVRDAYDKKIKDDPNAYTIGTVDHILIGLKDPNDPSRKKDLRTKEEALKRAQEVKEKLTKGGDFAALVKEYSDDPGSKENGGKYENAELSKYVPEFRKVALELPLNTISDPVATAFGYHIIKVEVRTTRSFDDVKDNIRRGLADGLINDFMTKYLLAYNYISNLPSPSSSGGALPSAIPGE